MHIPEGVLANMLCPYTIAAGTVCVGAAVYSVKNNFFKPEPHKFAAVTAFLFAIQMLNYPVTNGVSAHIIGGCLAALLLGTAPAVLSISILLIIQSVFFQDGGILALGANILTMAGINAGLGGFIINKINKKAPLRGISYFVITAFFVLMSALTCGLLVSFGKENPSAILMLMIKGHMVPSLIEALLTLSAVWLAQKSIFDTAKGFYLIAAAVIVVPFASSFPDGLTYVMDISKITETAGLFKSPMPGYDMPFIENSMISVYAAAIAGSLGIFYISKLSFKQLYR